MKKRLFTFLFLFSIVWANKAYALEGFPNCVYLGIGGGSNFNNGHGEFNLAIGYDRVFEETSPKISLGLLVEGVFSTHNHLLIGLPVGIYATDHLKFWVTPTYVHSGEEKHTEPDDEHFEYGDQFMLSFGTGYLIRINQTQFTMMPYLGGNLLNSQFIMSLGVKVGFNFK